MQAAGLTILIPNTGKETVRTLKRTLRLVAGWIFLTLGVLGLFLPILQGILFLAIGIILLAPDIPPFKRLLEWLRKRYPRVVRKADRLTNKLEEFEGGDY